MCAHTTCKLKRWSMCALQRREAMFYNRFSSNTWYVSGRCIRNDPTLNECSRHPIKLLEKIYSVLLLLLVIVLISHGYTRLCASTCIMYVVVLSFSLVCIAGYITNLCCLLPSSLHLSFSFFLGKQHPLLVI